MKIITYQKTGGLHFFRLFGRINVMFCISKTPEQIKAAQKAAARERRLAKQRQLALLKSTVRHLERQIAA